MDAMSAINTIFASFWAREPNESKISVWKLYGEAPHKTIPFRMLR